MTGSEAAGAMVAEQAGRHLKKCVLELGGSEAMIVLDDADVDRTAQCAIIGRLTVTGQVCVADKRMIVDAAVYGRFVEGITAALDGLHPGDPMDPSTTLAPLSSQAAADQVEAQIETAVEHGATAVRLGKPIPVTGAFVQPTILTGVTPDNPVYYEEIFVPVFMLFRVAGEEETLAIANDSPYGLGGTVYSTNIDRAISVAEQIEAGAISINQPIVASPSLPFGGIKLSGYGREFGAEGIKEFTNQKLINVAGLGNLV